MNTKPNQPDAIDKTLAALNSAAPPEGMESRIAHRLQQQPEQALPWSDRLVGFILASAWWRGAATGAAFAMLAVGAILLLQHKVAPRTQIAVTANTPAPTAMKVSESPAAPCAHPAILSTHAPSAPHTQLAAAPAASGSSHPIPSGPLTTQERALVHLAQIADPKILAALNSEHQAQLEAENAAQFEKFFTPPPRPPQPQDPPQSVSPPAQSSESSLPAATPEPASLAAPQSEPASPKTETSPNLN